MEALAVLVAVITLTAPASGASQRGSVMLPLLTDNRGNSFALSRLMSTKYPLCLLVMELAVALEQRSLALTAEWAPREWNAEADDLTNQRFSAFDPSLRVPFDMASHKWLVLGDLLKAGRDFYAEAQVARASVRQSGTGVRRGGRGKRARLKERDPW